MAEPRTPIITLTSDFGTGDQYVASVKASILSQTTHVHLVDVTHEVPPHDIVAAAFTIQAVAGIFPPLTVHVVVVDPGVGTDRRPIVVSSGNQYYVGPDNGVFTLVYESDPQAKVYHITATHYFREDPSPTFHGRDVFAPVAARLARGIGVENFGELVEDPVRLDLPRPKVSAEGRIRAAVLHVDRFGNLVTNITRGALNALLKKTGKTKVLGAGKLASVQEMRQTYAEGPEGAPFLLFNSSHHLEIATRQARAADMLSLEAGDAVEFDLA